MANCDLEDKERVHGLWSQLYLEIKNLMQWVMRLLHYIES
jgi:hypothetical protein